MIFSPASIDGSFIIDIEPRTDERGYFARMWCEREFTAHGLNPRVAQVNVSVSPKAGTLRGLHFQRSPNEEVKVVRCTRGKVFDVIVDLRPESATYRQWTGVELSGENCRMLYAPRGTAHGFLTLSDDAEVIYFTSEFYAPASATGMRYNDQSIRIAWPREVTTISDVDRNWPDYFVS